VAADLSLTNWVANEVWMHLPASLLVDESRTWLKTCLELGF